jgi:hypothetical protein
MGALGLTGHPVGDIYPVSPGPRSNRDPWYIPSQALQPPPVLETAAGSPRWPFRFSKLLVSASVSIAVVRVSPMPSNRADSRNP